MARTPDYDAPRHPVPDAGGDELIGEVTSRRTGGSSTDDLDETEAIGGGPDVLGSDEELTVAVVPMRVDEFRCARCFLVHHRSRLVAGGPDGDLCEECA
jgi:Domain of unknown function (DUF4193)